ncbi:MAG: UbiA-like polyprenyltransferase [Phycisphaerae bacterium]
MTNAAVAKPAVRPVNRIGKFLELIKFSHSIFAMPFAFLACFLASKAIGLIWPGWLRLALIVAAMVFARTFAMTFNRLVDRRIDAGNPRTARRPSVTGEISPMFMLAALAISAAGFVAVAWLFDFILKNPWPLWLAVPVLGWLALYSFTKRFTWLCHFFLGSSLMLAPVSAWVAIVPPRGPVLASQVVVLGLAVLLWTAGFDILYALQDESIDRRDRLFSLPARLGIVPSLWISRSCHVLTVVLLICLGVGQPAWGTTIALSSVYWLGLAIVALLLVIEQRLVKPHDISRINLAFMTVNGLVGIIFAICGIAAILLA